MGYYTFCSEEIYPIVTHGVGAKEKLEINPIRLTLFNNYSLQAVRSFPF